MVLLVVVSVDFFVVRSLHDPAVSWWARWRPYEVGLMLRWAGGGVAQYTFRAFGRGVASAGRMFFFGVPPSPQTLSYHC